MGQGTAGRKKREKRTGRRRPLLSGPERRLLIQLGASLAIFALALAGRNVFPQTASWGELLRRDVDLGAVLTQFGEEAEQDGFLDAFGELCIRVFAGEEVEEEPPPEGTDEPVGGILVDEIPAPAEGRHAWREALALRWESS